MNASSVTRARCWCGTGEKWTANPGESGLAFKRAEPLASARGQLYIPLREIRARKPLEPLDSGIGKQHGTRHERRAHKRVGCRLPSQLSPAIAAHSQRVPRLPENWSPLRDNRNRRAWATGRPQRAHLARAGKAGGAGQLLANLDVAPMILEHGLCPDAQGALLVIEKPAFNGNDFRQTVPAERYAGFESFKSVNTSPFFILDSGCDRLHQQVCRPAVRDPDQSNRAAPL